MMNPVIPTLASVRTRRRVERLSGCAGIALGDALAVGVGVSPGDGIGLAVAVAVDIAVGVGDAVGLGVGVEVGPDCAQ